MSDVSHKTGKIMVTLAAWNHVGGMESYARNLAYALKERGWDVALLNTNSPGDDSERLAEDFQFFDLSKQQLSIAKIRHCAAVINDFQPDFVVANHTALAQYALPLLARPIRPIVFVHSDDARFYDVAALAYRRVWRWLTPTPRLTAQLQKLLPNAHGGRVRTIPHGTHPCFFDTPSTTARIPSRVCFVGSQLRHKGIDLLPDILAQVQQVVPNVTLKIVGTEGDLQPTIAEAFAAHGLSEQVIWGGAVNQDAMCQVFDEAQLMLLPTRVEGFGLVAAEAMARGCVPVITQLDGVTDQIVQDGSTGRLVPMDDVDGFAAALIALLRDQEKLAATGHAARQAAGQFRPERMLDEYEKLFAESDDRALQHPASDGRFLTEFAISWLSNPAGGSNPLRRIGAQLFGRSR